MSRRLNGGSQGTALAASALAPAWLAAGAIANMAGAAHDAGVARTIGWDTQAWRALDLPVGSIFALLPLGTAAARAAMGVALALGMLGAMLFVVVRSLLAVCGQSPRLALLVACLAAVSATVSLPFQLEGTQPGGSIVGALLIFAPLALLATAESRPTIPWRAVAVAVGLAMGHEPLVGVCAIAQGAAFVLGSERARRSLAAACKVDGLTMAGCVLAGLSPFLLALERVREAGQSLSTALSEGWAGERGASLGGSPASYVGTHIGGVVVVLALSGAVLVALSSRARPLALALLADLVVGLACSWAGSPIGPSRFGAPLLAATAATFALAGVTLQAILRWVAQARLPYARASAAMVLLLALAIPADLADQSGIRTGLLARRGASARWDDIAWGGLPPRSAVLMGDRRLYARASAGRAQETVRADITLVPMFANGAPGRRALASDPALVPVWRDLELTGAPTEASLSSLASTRPVTMAYEPSWGRPTARHLVPVGLLDRFEPEPRGSSDRRLGLEAFAAQRDLLLRVIGLAAEKGRVLEPDAELTELAAALLRARVFAVVASADRDLVARALQDLHAFAPR